MAITKIQLALLSTFIVLLPIIAGFIKFKLLALHKKQLLFFLCFGFMVDASYLFINPAYRKGVLNIYSLAEAVFYFYFLSSICQNKSAQKICLTLLCTMPVLWLFQIIWFKSQPHHVAYFEILYRMILSIISGVVILLLVERSNNVFKTVLFWLTGAIFFYCTCSFFAFVFMNSTIVKQMWYLHNIVNIITCVLFLKGMLMIKDDSQKESNPKWENQLNKE